MGIIHENYEPEENKIFGGQPLWFAVYPELKCYASIVHRILKYVVVFGYVGSDFFFVGGGGAVHS